MIHDTNGDDTSVYSELSSWMLLGLDAGKLCNSVLSIWKLDTFLDIFITINWVLYVIVNYFLIGIFYWVTIVLGNILGYLTNTVCV